MNNFEKALLSYIGEENIRKIQSVKVGLAGAGGIGSNCALNLVRSGFKNLKIVDFDCVEYSNLNRQFYFFHQIGAVKVEALKENLFRINPDLTLEISNEKIEEHNVGNIFSDCNIVVEAFDKVTYKKLLVEAYANSNKLLVAISGIAGWGNSDKIKIHKIKDNFYVVGDMSTEVSRENPPISPRVNIAAAKLADTILNYVISS